jgi:SAM-dependent methyltransferase
MMAAYLGTTYRRRRLPRDLATLQPWLRGDILDIGEWQGLDVPRTVLDKFPHVKTTIPGTADAIPFPDESFDTVLSVDTFEHVERPCEAVRECARVLRTDGHLILAVPFMWPVHIDERAPYLDYTRWTDYQWRRVLDAAGLNPQTIVPQGGLLDVILEAVKAGVRRWPRPWRYLGYATFPLLDGLHAFDRPTPGPPPARQVFTGGWLILAAKPSRFARTA